jgi:hypothetical protein
MTFGMHTIFYVTYVIDGCYWGTMLTCMLWWWHKNCIWIHNSFLCVKCHIFVTTFLMKIICIRHLDGIHTIYNSDVYDITLIAQMSHNYFRHTVTDWACRTSFFSTYSRKKGIVFVCLGLVYTVFSLLQYYKQYQRS